MVEHLKTDYRQAALDPRPRAMLDYVVKLTREPWAMGPADVEVLRAVGFTDAEILDMAQVTAYYAFVNRITDGLGVALESFWESEP